MNPDLFKSLLKPYWIAKTAKNFDEAADQISTAYHLANIGDTKTLFGAALISADKDILKTFLSIGLGVNFYLASATNAVASEVEVLNKPLFPDKIKLDKDGKRIKETAGTSGTSGTSNTSGTSGTSGTSQLAENITNEVDNLTGNIGFKIIATGFCLYWITAKFSPMPPMPPMISPLNGVNVLFPGIPTDLAVDIRNAFSNTKIDDTIDALSLSFMKHLLTIGGIYSGYIAAGTILVPMVLPWVTLLGSPPSLDNLAPSMSFEDIMKILKQELNKLIESFDIMGIIRNLIKKKLDDLIKSTDIKNIVLGLILNQMQNIKLEDLNKISLDSLIEFANQIKVPSLPPTPSAKEIFDGIIGKLQEYVKLPELPISIEQIQKFGADILNIKFPSIPTIPIDPLNTFAKAINVPGLPTVPSLQDVLKGISTKLGEPKVPELSLDTLKDFAANTLGIKIPSIPTIDISGVISKVIGTIPSVEILENFAESLGATLPDSPSKEEILTLIEEQLKNVKDPTKQLNGFLDVLDELNEENFTTLDLIALAKSFI